MTRVLVTGASGAIGTALVQRLQSTAYDVVGLDKRASRWEPDVSFVQCDLTEHDQLPSADVVIHLAAHSQVQPIIDDPSLAVENVRMTDRVLRHADRENATVILASSREVYGSAVRPTTDSASVETTNPYGASKIASESFSSAFDHCFDVDVITLRLANVYGPYDCNPRVVPIFVSLALAGEELTVYGDSKVLDFCYVDDVVAAFEYAVDHRSSLAGETINVGSGTGTTLSELAERIVDAVEGCPGYRVTSNRTGDTETYVANIQQAEALLGHDPTPLRKGLPRTIEWYHDHEQVRADIRASLGDD